MCAPICDRRQDGAREACCRLDAAERGCIRRKPVGSPPRGGAGNNMADHGHGRARSLSVQSGASRKPSLQHRDPPVPAHLCALFLFLDRPPFSGTVCHVKGHM